MNNVIYVSKYISSTTLIHACPWPMVLLSTFSLIVGGLVGTLVGDTIGAVMGYVVHTLSIIYVVQS